MDRRDFVRALGLAGPAAALPAAAGVARAQGTDWPARAVRIIVPAPAGGPYDRALRPIAQEMSALLRQPVVVDNRPSAGNIVGTLAGAKAAPDGYTLTMTGMLNTIAAGLYDGVPFDIVGDFAHVGAIGAGAQALLARADAGYASFADLMARAKREPGKVDYATSGAGSAGHLLMELLQRAAGVSMTHIAYKGGAPALQDLLAGVVGVAVLPPNVAIPHLQSGRLKLLAMSSGARVAQFTDAPTFAELGYPQLTVTSWVGLSAPRGTPAAVVGKLNATLYAALKNPAVLGPLEADGLIPMHTTPDEYARLVRSDTERWTALVRSLGLKAN